MGVRSILTSHYGHLHSLSDSLTSISMLQKHYDHLTPTLAADQLAGKLYPDLFKEN